MEREEYLLNEVGIEIAKENIAKAMRKAMQDKEKESFKFKTKKLLQDLEKIQRGDIETIKRYMEETEIE
ncbi:MAG: hypothetical protein HFJ48_03510 [Clostridia bacterium]|nr:hypothetical protein [Clostridia bacterium]